jgi:hypothetical protein
MGGARMTPEDRGTLLDIAKRVLTMPDPDFSAEENGALAKVIAQELERIACESI